jgi:hypothetical protein
MLDRRDRSEADCSGRKAGALQQFEHDELDAAGIDALDLLEQIFKRRRQSVIRAVVIRLPPAGDALVGIDADQQAWPVADALHEGAE